MIFICDFLKVHNSCQARSLLSLAPAAKIRHCSTSWRTTWLTPSCNATASRTYLFLKNGAVFFHSKDETPSMTAHFVNRNATVHQAGTVIAILLTLLYPRGDNCPTAIEKEPDSVPGVSLRSSLKTSHSEGPLSWPRNEGQQHFVRETGIQRKQSPHFNQKFPLRLNDKVQTNYFVTIQCTFRFKDLTVNLMDKKLLPFFFFWNPKCH